MTRWHPLRSVCFITAVSIALWIVILGFVGWAAR